MMDPVLAHLALRNRALSLVVATTGAISLSATLTGFARAAGSFIADGFAVGMEVSVAGAWTVSGNTAPGVITAVTATDLTIRGGRTAEAAAGGRTISVGFPALRAWENKRFTPIPGRPYAEDDFVPAPSELLTAPSNGGVLEETGLYLIRWYGLSNTGLAIRKPARKLLDLFAAGTAFAVGSDALRISGDPGPWQSRIEPLDGGWSAIEVSIPWFAHSINTVAA